jgi:hypothetical protein
MRLVAFSPRLAGLAAELLGEPAIRIYRDKYRGVDPGTGSWQGRCLCPRDHDLQRYRGALTWDSPDPNDVSRCSTTTSAFYNTRTITTGAEVSLWIWQQYLDTNDLSFLRQNFPLMAAAAQFLLSYTTGATDGLLHTYPSNAHESQWDVHDPTTDIAAETARDCGRRIAHQAHADLMVNVLAVRFRESHKTAPCITASSMSATYYSKQHVGDRGSVDQDSLGKQATEVASSGGLDVLAKPLANGDVSVVLFNENSSTATISTTAGAISKTGASSYTLTNLWTGATSTTTGSIRPTPRGPR